jgi:hypothetical protein
MALPALVALLSIAACATAPVGEPLPVPVQTNAGAADPTRQAVLSASWAFGRAQRLPPADAARAVAQLEYLSASLPTDPRWAGASPIVFSQLALGRTEVRDALGVAPSATPAVAIRGFADAAVALDQGDRTAAAAALAPIAPGGGTNVLSRLEPLPSLPIAAAATRNAEQEMLNTDQRDPF